MSTQATGLQHTGNNSQVLNENPLKDVTEVLSPRMEEENKILDATKPWKTEKVSTLVTNSSSLDKKIVKALDNDPRELVELLLKRLDQDQEAIFLLTKHMLTNEREKRWNMVNNLYETTSTYLDNLNNKLHSIYFGLQTLDLKSTVGIKNQADLYQKFLGKDVKTLEMILKLVPAGSEKIKVKDIEITRDERLEKAPDHENPNLTVLSSLKNLENPSILTGIILGGIVSQILHKVSSDTTKTGTVWPKDSTKIDSNTIKTLEYFTQIGALNVSEKQVDNAHQRHSEILQANFTTNKEKLLPLINDIGYKLGTLETRISQVMKKFDELKSPFSPPEGYPLLETFKNIKKLFDNEHERVSKELDSNPKEETRAQQETPKETFLTKVKRRLSGANLPKLDLSGTAIEKRKSEKGFNQPEEDSTLVRKRSQTDVKKK